MAPTTTTAAATSTASTSPSPPQGNVSPRPSVMVVIIIGGLASVAILWYVWWRVTAQRRQFQRMNYPTVSPNSDQMQQVHHLPSVATPLPMPPLRARSQPRRTSSTAPLSSLPTLSQMIASSRPTSSSGTFETEIKTPTGFECPICYEDMTGRVSVGSSLCGHQLCQSCRALVMSTAEADGLMARCHACRAPYV